METERELRTIVIVAYEGIEILDAAGPIEVFDMANREQMENGSGHPAYVIRVLAGAPGPFATSCGVGLVADSAWERFVGPIDTLIVVGSCDTYLYPALADRRLIEWLGATGPGVRRLVSVCTGAFLLAEAGLLDGKRATTHWMDLERLRGRYPLVSVEPDVIYVRDGSVATSAGVSSGMDLALALVEEDLGRKVALEVARRMVLFLKRPGGQAQFSSHLMAQMAADSPLAPLLDWLQENIHLDPSVDELAERVAMSPRNFSRIFVRDMGMTPAKYVDQIRFERALQLLDNSGKSLSAIASETGYSSNEQLRRAFQRRMGITPLEYRERC